MPIRFRINRPMLAVVVAVAAGAIVADQVPPLHRKATSAFLWVTGLDYVPVSVLGDVVFRVPNRYLAFRWSRDEHPASTMCRFSEDYRRQNKGLCAELAVQGSFSMVLRVKLRDTADKVVSWTSLVTVHYGSPAPFPHDMLAHLDVWQRGHAPIRRDPQHDVADFEAFRMLPRPNMPPSRLFTDFIHETMIRRDKGEPQSVDCDTSSEDPGLEDATCETAVGFLAQAYPQNADLSYRYWLGFTLPIRLLPQSAQVARLVAAQVYRFIS